MRALAASAPSGDGAGVPSIASIPNIELYAIDVSFGGHPDAAERDYLNETPTSFVLSADQVDRLRAAAGVAIRASPEFQRLLHDLASPSRAGN